MPILQNKTKNNQKIIVYIGDSKYELEPMNFQEYKQLLGIKSDEYDDLEKGYCIISMFGVVFMEAVMCKDMFDINSI